MDAHKFLTDKINECSESTAAIIADTMRKAFEIGPRLSVDGIQYTLVLKSQTRFFSTMRRLELIDNIPLPGHIQTDRTSKDYEDLYALNNTAFKLYTMLKDNGFYKSEDNK